MNRFRILMAAGICLAAASANSQQISWSAAPGAAPMVVSFLSFEEFDGSGLPPSVTVRGGRLESLTVTPVIE